MKTRTLVLIGLSPWALGLSACGKEEVPAVVEPPAAEAEALAAREAAEAKRRAGETEALAARLAEIDKTIREMGSAAGSAPLSRELEESIGSLAEAASSPHDLLEALGQAGGDDWASRRDRAEQALDDLEERVDAVATSLAEWRRREQAANDARQNLELPRDPGSGLIQGLDGGLYDRYLASVIEDVQRELRARGLYAGQVDGYLDTVTQQAIGGFQKQAELAVSGVPSPMTRDRLFAADETD